MNKHLSQQIKTLRKTHSFSQEMMAEKLQMSLRYFQKIESGAIDLKFSLIEKISNCFQVAPQVLLSSEHAPSTLMLENLHLGFAIQSLDGRLMYINRFIREFWNAQEIDLNDKIYYPWHFADNQELGEEIISWFNNIAQTLPKPEPLFLMKILKNGKKIIVRNDWEYQYDTLEPHKVIGLNSIVSLHAGDATGASLLEAIIKDRNN